MKLTFGWLFLVKVILLKTATYSLMYLCVHVCVCI